MPHSLIQTLFGSAYNHSQHELVRMYGALTLAQVGTATLESVAYSYV